MMAALSFLPRLARRLAAPSSSRAFAGWFAATTLGFLWLLAAANVVIDPYGVFGLNLFSADTTPNSRYRSFAAYWRGRERFDGVVLGASRVGCSLDVADLDRSVPGVRFAPLWGEAANPTELSRMLRAVLRDRDERASPLRMIVVQIDVDGLGFDPVDHSLFTRLHPRASGASAAAFFAEALFVPAYRLMARKLDYNLTHAATGPVNMCDSSVGLARWRELPIASAPRPVRSVTQRPGFAAHVAAVAEMAAMARERSIPFVVFTAPLHPLHRAGFDDADLARALDALAHVTPLWHFESPPWLAEDDALWTDPGHYVRSVGRLILARVFDRGDVAVPPGFGARLAP